MFNDKLGHMLLGKNYTESEYSPGFKCMINRVANKIYRRKEKRKFLMTNKVNPTLNNNHQEKETKRQIYTASSRKNSPNIKNANFFNTFRHGRPKVQKLIEKNKSPQKTQQTETKWYKSPSQLRQKRLSTEPCSPSNYVVATKYDKCLMTQPLKCLERGRANFGLGQGYTERRQLSSFRQSVKVKYSKRNIPSRQSSSERNPLKQGLRSTSLPICFKDDLAPWQASDFQYPQF